jgi:protoporphyrinogen oxidase
MPNGTVGARCGGAAAAAPACWRRRKHQLVRASPLRRRGGQVRGRAAACGLHRGDAARLSLRALFPMLADAERRHGSVARAWRTMPVGAGAGGSMSLRGGLGALPAGMSAALPLGVAVTGANVVAIERSEDGFRVHARDHATVTARTVVLATPAYVTSTLTAGLDDELATLCGGIRYVSAVNVVVSSFEGGRPRSYARLGIRCTCR